MANAEFVDDFWDDSSVAHIAPPPESQTIARDYRGLWVALTNCRFDNITKKPVEGDIVDFDQNFSELSDRMRRQGRCSCAIVFCDDRLCVESHAARSLS